MKKTYKSPQIEVLEIELEDIVLQASINAIDSMEYENAW